MEIRLTALGIVGSALLLAGCGPSTGATYAPPFELPVGPSAWDATAPSWLLHGTLHVGESSVRLGRRVDQYVLGATGAYWMRGSTLMFTSAEGATERVEDVGWGNLAVSADRSVLATVDQSRGPTDDYGTHVLQVAAFDTRTGEQLYRTPDEEPDDRADLAQRYSETMPLLHGASDDALFYDEVTIDLADGSTTEAGNDAEGVTEYAGLAETLFADGYHVGLRGEGDHRRVSATTAYGSGRLSPDRSTLFDVTYSRADAVVYDADTGERRTIDAPWRHFSLVAFSDDDTFFGLAQRIRLRHVVDPVRAQQVVSCEVATLECTPVSPVVRTDDAAAGRWPTFLTEGGRGGQG